MSESRSHLPPAPVGPPGPGSLDLEAVRRRDAAALERFFEEYFDRVYALAYRLTGERTRAEDLSQEVFLRVHRFADTLDASRDPWPWLATITHRARTDRARRGDHRLHQRAVSLDQTEGLAAAAAVEDGRPDDDAESRERTELVRQALDELPDEQRTVIVLRDWEGMTHKQIAEVTERSEVATRKLYSRAIAALGTGLRRVLG